MGCCTCAEMGFCGAQNPCLHKRALGYQEIELGIFFKRVLASGPNFCPIAGFLITLCIWAPRKMQITFHMRYVLQFFFPFSQRGGRVGFSA